MDILFKITAPNPSDPPQVGDTNFLEHYTGINRSMAWAEIAPGIRQATERFVLPFVGETFYDYLAENFNTGATLSSNLRKALRYLQDAIANYTVFHLSPERTSFFSSLGNTQTTPSDGSGQPAPQWATKSKRWAALENGDLFLDKLLAFMEQQVMLGTSEFNEWKNDPAYSRATSHFFRHTDELDEHLNMQGSRRAFISLVKYMKRIEEEEIAETLCTAQFDSLAAKYKAGTMNAAEKNLFRLVRKAVANLGLAAAVPHHRVLIDGDGFRFASQVDGFDERKSMTNSFQQEAIQSLQKAAEEKGRAALAAVRSFLKANVSDFALWADSECNQRAAGRSHHIVVSRDGRGGIGIF